MLACGYRAIDALRVEKGYRVWGADITPEETPDEAGLGFAVKPDKGVDFRGREALLRAREGTPERRLACLVLADPKAVCLGQEPVRVGGEVAGRVTSGGYGFAVGRSIAYAYVPAAAAEVGTAVEVEVFGEWVGAEVAAEPLWDPGGRADPLVGQAQAAGWSSRTTIVWSRRAPVPTIAIGTPTSASTSSR